MQRRDAKQELCDNIQWTWDAMGKEKSVRMGIQRQLGQIEKNLMTVERGIGRMSINMADMQKHTKAQEKEWRYAREECSRARTQTEGWVNRCDAAIRKLLELEAEKDRKLKEVESEVKQEASSRAESYQVLKVNIDKLSDKIEMNKQEMEESRNSQKETDRWIREELSSQREQNDKLKQQTDNHVEIQRKLKYEIYDSREQMEYFEHALSGLRERMTLVSRENMSYKDTIARIEMTKRRDEEAIISLKREVEKLKLEQKASLATIQSCLKLIYDVVNKKIDLHDTNLMCHLNKMYNLNAK